MRDAVGRREAVREGADSAEVDGPRRREGLFALAVFGRGLLTAAALTGGSLRTAFLCAFDVATAFGAFANLVRAAPRAALDSPVEAALFLGLAGLAGLLPEPDGFFVAGGLSREVLSFAFFSVLRAISISRRYRARARLAILLPPRMAFP